jgi:hypothetical protein
VLCPKIPLQHVKDLVDIPADRSLRASHASLHILSPEHNDGFVRTPYVEKMFGPEMYALFIQVKKIFDPHNIFNPGKKVGTTFSDAFAHLDLTLPTSSK